MTIFSQPSWTDETGRPYPGAEHVAEIIKADEERAAVQEQAKIDKLRTLARREGQRQADAEEGILRRLTLRPASSITPCRTGWLWAPGEAGHGRIPLGELTLIVGRGGVGKSTVLGQMAAWITTGDMQGDYWAQPRHVLYVANEDSLAKTVVPRLIAAGADLTRIHFVGIEHLGEEGRVLLPTDCPLIETEAARADAAAIMIDPLSSNLRVDNANDAKSVRLAVEAIRKMAEKANIAAIGLAHTRKADSKNLMDAIMGSSELGNVCRSVMGVMADPDDDDRAIVLSQEKSNLGRTDLPGYRYRIVDHTFGYGNQIISTSRVEFLGKTDQTVSDMLADAAGGNGGHMPCAEWMKDYLMLPGTGGEATRGELLKAARNEGEWSRATVDRAIRRLGLKSRPSGQGASRIFYLP